MFEFITNAFGDTKNLKWGSILTTLGIGLGGAALTAASGGSFGAVVITALVALVGATMFSPAIQSGLSGLGNMFGGESPKSTPKADPNITQSVRFTVNQPDGKKPIDINAPIPDTDILRDQASYIRRAVDVMDERSNIERDLPAPERESALKRVKQAEESAVNFVANIAKLRDEGKKFNDTERGPLREAIKASKKAAGGVFNDSEIPTVPVEQLDNFLRSLTPLTPELEQFARNRYVEKNGSDKEFGKDNATNTSPGQIIFVYNELNTVARDSKPDWENTDWFKKNSTNTWWDTHLANEVRTRIKDNLDNENYVAAEIEIQRIRSAFQKKPDQLTPYGKKLREDIEADKNAKGYLDKLFTYANAKRRLKEVEGLYSETLDKINDSKGELVRITSDYASAVDKAQKEADTNNKVLASQEKEAGGASRPGAPDGAAISHDVQRKAQAAIKEGSAALQQMQETSSAALLTAATTPARKAEEKKANPFAKISDNNLTA